MRIGSYDLDLTVLSKQPDSCLLLQLPEGLMQYAQEIIEAVEKATGAKVYLYQDPTFGACDVPLWLIGTFADGIVHVGHSPMAPSNRKNVYFIEGRMHTDMSVETQSLVEKLIQMQVRSAVLTASVQYLQFMPVVSDALASNGISVEVGKPQGRIHYPGQILGCNFSSANIPSVDADVVVFLGSGRFHPTGIAITSGRDVVVFNPITREVQVVKRDNTKVFIRKRWAAITLGRKARSFGVIVSVKPGQARLALGEEIRSLAESEGRRADIILADRINPDVINYYPYEAFVNTACPRIATDDYFKFKKPVLTPYEFRIAIGVEEWNGIYSFDELD